MSLQASEFERILLVANPKSAHYERLGGIISAIEAADLGIGLTLLHTEDPSVVNNVELIAGSIKPGDIVGGASGDGGDKTIYEAHKLVGDEGSIDLSEIAFMPIPLGDGNDLATSIYGKGILKNKAFVDIFTSGQTRWVDAIQIEDDSNGTRYAHSYVGIGYTGLVAAYLNNPNFRRARSNRAIKALSGKVVDAPAALLASVMKKPFDYQDPNGEQHSAQEKLFAIMPNMAGGSIKFDIDPFDTRMLTVEFAPERFTWEVLKRMLAEGLRGGFKGEVIESSQFTLLSPATMHEDGEPRKVAPGTTLTVSRVSNMLQILTKPKK